MKANLTRNPGIAKKVFPPGHGYTAVVCPLLGETEEFLAKYVKARIR